MNGIQFLLHLNNQYVAMRHGTSQANAEKRIISDPNVGDRAYGLTDEGREQVRTSVKSAREQGLLDSYTLILSSTFLRAMQTAEIARAILNCGKVTRSESLRERFFGRWEGCSNDYYHLVWETDATGETHNLVEPVDRVQERVSNLVLDLEKSSAGKTILLVSHGDALQILQTAFLKRPARQHRQVPHLETAEIRCLQLANGYG